MAEALSLLLEAPSKDLVQKIFTHVFLHRNDISQAKPAKFVPLFEKGDAVTEDHVQALFAAAHTIVISGLYSGVGTADEARAVVEQHAASLDERLKALLAKLLLSNMPAWREAAIMSMPSLPSLLDVDWRVDIKTATERVGRMAVPTVLVDLKTRQQPSSAGVVPGVENVSFELSKEALDTMIDGLGRIRDQLSGVGGSKEG
eukprot:g2916.t1